ncbi:MAG: Fe(3+) dicitrate transport ATP-binding protein FecE [Verrucomicrobiae bacterium]|nr:Fe(3+) dicitrate transport ATP-binding protein FecE [Verrucomicrobiae bacterium]
MNLRVENLSFSYRPGAPVLQELNLEIAPGKVTGLFGPNGSGKSTLLRCLTGALRPQSGACWCGDRRVDTLAPRAVAQRIAVVPQDTPRGVSLTAREMVALGRFAWGDEDADILASSLTRVGARELAERTFDELSGGERQRVVIARALAQATPVLLLDEPATHLDIAHQLELYRLARALAGEGRTVVMVCHDLLLAPLFVDQAVLLHAGHIHASGSPATLFNREHLITVFGVDAVVAHSAQGVQAHLNAPA